MIAPAGAPSGRSSNDAHGKSTKSMPSRTGPPSTKFAFETTNRNRGTSTRRNHHCSHCWPPLSMPSSNHSLATACSVTPHSSPDRSCRPSISSPSHSCWSASAVPCTD
jgi:hypothetical protein